MSPIPSPVPATAGEVLDLVRHGEATTRSEIGRVTGLSRTAVSARLAALLESGLVTEGEEGPSGGGRPPTLLRFNRHIGVVLALAIGRSRSQLAVCELDGSVLVEHDEDQEMGIGPDELMPRLVDRCRELMVGIGRPFEDVWAIGASIPGTVDFTAGASRESPILSGWDGVALAPYFADLSGAPMHLDNDANVMAASEFGGLLRTYSDFLVLKASTGLGAGLVVGGRVVRGADGAAGELGHVKSRAADGRVCRCGETGCLEAVASGWALVQTLRESGRPVDHVRALVALALDGDPEARGLVRESGRQVGEAVAGAVNLLNPQAVVVGGDLAAAFDLFVAGLREGLYSHTSAVAARRLDVLPTTHGARAGIVGCAALALEAVLSPAAVDQRLREVNARAR